MRKSIPKFKINVEYLTSVVEKKPIVLELEGGGTIKGDSTGCIDHPEFTKLREELGQQGFIQIERGWWNGDRTLKAFQLNGIKFKVGDQFPCASALGVKIRVMNKKCKV